MATPPTRGELESNERPSSADRDAIRSTQRIASQLHQLIAASITVTGLRHERDIVENLASSARRVFDADDAVLSLESGSMAPLMGVARRAEPARWLGADDVSGLDDVPTSRPGVLLPWEDRDWLVAPLLERRDQPRGVLGVRRDGGNFADEDREVLTLLAQMATTALAATELSRGVETSETRLRTLVETAPAGIVEVNPNGRVLWWNRAASKIFAWPPYDARAREPRLPEAAKPELALLWLEVLDGAATSGRDLIDIDIKGRHRDLTVSAALFESPDDRGRSILMLVDDVTDHRQLKAEVHHAQQMEVRGRVASSVAHDFNNLLTLISGYAEILSKDLSEDERSLEMVRDIQATASRASMLTAQLQTIGRTQLLEPVVLDPVAVLQASSEVLERVVGGDIEILWSLDLDAGTIRVDAGQFEQMLLNLAINARDAMAEGGELRISVSAVTIASARSIDLVIEEGDYVLIAFTDTGVGMDEETRQHCFDPFFTTKGLFKGTGLGLAAARRLVEGSGGAITCHSQLGHGTTFEILIPASGEAVVEEPPGPVSHRPRGSATVLVAENNDELRRLMVRVLSRNGYEVLVAASGEEAVTLARAFEGTIDLLVSDVEMSELSGPELAASLQEGNPGLRVLLTSGTATASAVEELTAGTAAFLAKPFRPSALIDQVHDLLARR